MKKMRILSLVLALAGALALSSVAEAKSVNWNKTESSGMFLYNTNWTNFPNDNGWGSALANPNISITYQAQVRNMSSGGTILPDGASIPVGTQLRFEPLPYSGSDISWFGSGYAADSPNGHWVANATPPGSWCDPADYAGGYFSVSRYSAYIPLSINPPANSVNHGGTAGLSCDASRQNCTVTSPGSINTTFTFNATYGKFYYSYDGYDVSLFGGYTGPVSCHYQARPLNFTPVAYGNGWLCMDSGVGGPKCSLYNVGSAYTLSVPVQTISYSLFAVSSNNPPAAPVISGPATGSAGTAYSWTATSRDSDGDTLRYGYDWDLNGSIDQWMPAAGFVPSGTSQSASYSWVAPGAHTFQVLAQDSKGASSSWSSYTITLTSVVNGLCGAANGIATLLPPGIGLCTSGTPTAVTPAAAPGPYSWTCQGSGGGANASCSAPYDIPAPSFDLKINGSDGPLAVSLGTNLNIVWTPVTNAVSCTGSGNGWNTPPAKSLAGGSDNVSATAAALYALTCYNAEGDATTDTVSVSLANILKVCEGSCSSSFMRGKSGAPQSFTMARGSSKSLVACYNPAADCSDPSGNVTAAFTEGGGSAISLSGTNPVIVTANAPGTESMSASYSGQTANMDVTVICVPTTSCAADPRGDDYCPSETYTIDDSCGTTLTCNGRRTCDYNWKEVAP
ncbi:MAG: hypothetical protein A2808_02765 [Candidatus Moranbacteria bacterium RIFCSPHIGHO2_01_FULL_55_24]|nr:MAG: hypothetical protein A2808_02765 [Candidatus Moranbacteria bacterium RIFCSPHIGHO2_01_FULL_55_24]